MSNCTVPSAVDDGARDELTGITAAMNAILFDWRSHFYLVKPSEAMFENQEDVPNFQSGISFFTTVILVERLVLFYKNRSVPPWTETASSVILGVFHEIFRLLLHGFEYSSYVYVYQNYRIYELPWNSAITWYVAAILVDFCYYWGHRSVHEINILWGTHQAHHSSEHYVFSTALRIGVFDTLSYLIIDIPMALFVPPAQFITHRQLNFMYQFWVHTELIGTVGPLEYIFNTASHHRVHHGCNDYCLDKNFGGVLIIWDRIFGTFAAERKEEPIVYGLVEPVESVNPFYLDFNYCGKVYQKFCAVTGWKNKFKAIMYGPAWQPGSPRLGWPDKLPGIKPRGRFQVPSTREMDAYIVLHFLLTDSGLMMLHLVYKVWPLSMVWLHAFYIAASLIVISALFERKRYGPLCEFIRCSVLFAVIGNYGLPLLEALEPIAHIVFLGQSIPIMVLLVVKTVLSLSAILWGTVLFQKYLQEGTIV